MSGDGVPDVAAKVEKEDVAPATAPEPTGSSLPAISAAVTDTTNGGIPEQRIEDGGKKEIISIEAIPVHVESPSNGITSLHLPTPDSTETQMAVTTSITTTTSSTTTVTNGTTVDVIAGTQNDRPWDFSNRKVVVQGVDKFHDVKTATKMVQKWLDTTSTSTTAPSASTTTTNTSLFVIDKIKKPPKSNWLLVTLQNEAMVQPFIEFINTSNIKSRKGNNVFAKVQQQQSNHNDDDENNNNHGRDRRRRHRDDDGEEENSGALNEDDMGDAATNTNSHKRPRRSIQDEFNKTARRPISKEELYNKIIPLWNMSSSSTEQAQYKMKEMIKKCAMKIIVEIKNKFRYVLC